MKRSKIFSFLISLNLFAGGFGKLQTYATKSLSPTGGKATQVAQKPFTEKAKKQTKTPSPEKPNKNYQSMDVENSEKIPPRKRYLTKPDLSKYNTPNSFESEKEGSEIGFLKLIYLKIVSKCFPVKSTLSSSFNQVRDFIIQVADTTSALHDDFNSWMIDYLCFSLNKFLENSGAKIETKVSEMSRVFKNSVLEHNQKLSKQENSSYNEFINILKLYAIKCGVSTGSEHPSKYNPLYASKIYFNVEISNEHVEKLRTQIKFQKLLKNTQKICGDKICILKSKDQAHVIIRMTLFYLYDYTNYEYIWVQ